MIKLKNLQIKNLFFIIFIVSLSGVIGSLVAQFIFKLQPCQMCILQRIAIILVAIISFICLFLPLNKKIISIIANILVIIPTLFGLTIAIRHIIILNTPSEQYATCGAGLSFLFKTLPLNEFITSLFMGTSDCTIVQKFFFVPVPIWSLIFFTLIIIGLLGQFFIKKK